MPAGQESNAEGEPVELGTREHPITARLVSRDQPYRYVTLTWRHGRTRCTLFGADLTPLEIQRIARSMTRATPPAPGEMVTRSHRPRRPRGEPSLLPTDGPPEPEEDQRPSPPVMPWLRYPNRRR